MESDKVYFRENFWSSGQTDILDERERRIGILDLHGMFNEGVTVRNTSQLTGVSGRFKKLSNIWLVLDRAGREVGCLKAKFSFTAKRYTYDRIEYGTLLIESPAFSREYTIRNEKDRVVAEFRRISGMFATGAFELSNRSELPTEEVIAIVMGVHAIQKRHENVVST